jgi:hypothetical protein
MITSATRPDPNYYIHIQQHDDGSWTADPMPLDDQSITIPMLGTMLTKGLRTLTKDQVDLVAFQSIELNAPADMQRNSLYIVAQGSATTGYASAKACLDWVNAMNAFRDNQKALINTMTFDQLVVYTVPTGWPALPSNMPTKAFIPGALENRMVRDAPKITRPTISQQRK